jgi:CheY-like chemotaxis protein
MSNLLGQRLPLVLIIDDNQEILEEVAAVLLSANIASHGCTRSEEAFAVATESQPDLILCDMNLFGESGPEVCERIRQQPGLERIPVMFLSTSQMPDIIRRSHGSSSTYCIRKPFSPDVLLGLIETAIGHPHGILQSVASGPLRKTLLDAPQLMAVDTVQA